MKTTASSILLLAAAAGIFASPTARNANYKRQTGCILPTISPVDGFGAALSIGQWNKDVNAVNNFLDNASAFIGNARQLSEQASAALTAASDEPCQLGTLSSNPALDFSSTSFGPGCAVANLNQVFSGVLSNLQDIINDPGNEDGANTAVNSINLIRCCGVLPDLDILWKATLDAAGQSSSDSIPSSPARPAACASISCDTVLGASRCAA